MTRDDIRSRFPDATEEQITELLNINGTDIESAKKNSIEPEELARLQGIETKYNDLTNEGLTDAEKLQKAMDDAAAEKSKYARASNKIEMEKIFIAAGMKSENYEKFIDSITSDDAEACKDLAQNLADNFKAVKESTEKETKASILKNMPDLGGTGGDPDDEGGKGMSDAEKVAKSIAESQKESADTSASVLESYL